MGQIPILEQDLDIIAKLADEPTKQPTEGSDEPLTPEEFKAKFDEAAKIIQEYLNGSLVPGIRAENIPCAAEDVNGNTISAALTWLVGQISKAQVGELGDNIISYDMLKDAVKNVLDSGKPVVSETAPTAGLNGQGLADGQIWLKTLDGKFSSLNILSKGTWHSFGEDVLPVGKGGTGKKTFGEGKLLYGLDGAIGELAAPAEEPHYLGFENGHPAWKEASGIGDLIERIKVKYGSYEGTSKPREIELEVTPKVLLILNNSDYRQNISGAEYYPDGFYVLANGQEVSRAICLKDDEKDKYNYHFAKVSLSGSKLIFSDEKGSSVTKVSAPCANAYENIYSWVAIY